MMDSSAHPAGPSEGTRVAAAAGACARTRPGTAGDPARPVAVSQDDTCQYRVGREAITVVQERKLFLRFVLYQKEFSEAAVD